MEFQDPRNSILLPPGNKAIFRYAVPEIPTGWRIATPEELLTACLGYPFPWGRTAEAVNAPRCWSKPCQALDQKQRMGVSGLFHRQWFKVSDGRRYGGASNVPDTLPGSMRCNLRFGGGECPSSVPEENEGFAVVKEFCNACRSDNMNLYRLVQHQALTHVTPDGGEVIVSPLGDSVAHVGFVGRCLWCPNPETISFPQLLSRLRTDLPDYRIELYPEWQHWRL